MGKAQHKKYEYKQIIGNAPTSGPIAHLNECGKYGWRLVSITEKDIGTYLCTLIREVI